jgi:hypothetical protein
LLNPDEIGRFLARVDDPQHPVHPGIVLVIIPGEHPLPARRINYFASHWFDGFFDPHPDHRPPPTLAHRIQQIAADKLKQLTAALAPHPTIPRRKIAALTATIVVVAGTLWEILGSRAPQPVVEADSPYAGAERIDTNTAKAHGELTEALHPDIPALVGGSPASPPIAVMPAVPPPATAAPVSSPSPAVLSEVDHRKETVINSYLMGACRQAYN